MAAVPQRSLAYKISALRLFGDTANERRPAAIAFYIGAGMNLKTGKEVAEGPTGQIRAVVIFDPVLGYRVEPIKRQTF